MSLSPRPRVSASPRRTPDTSPRRHLLVSLSPCLLVCLTLLPLACVEDATDLQSARDQAASTLDQARARESTLSHQLSTLPANDPLRLKLQPQLDRLDQFITSIQQELPKLDAALQSAKTASQPPDPTLTQAVSAIPYGSLALALLGLTIGVGKHVQASNLLSKHQQSQKAFTQIVEALDSLLPSPPTPAQQATITAALASTTNPQSTTPKP